MARDADVPAHGWWFGEDQARYVLATSAPDAILAVAKAAGVPARILGKTGGVALTGLGAEPISLKELREAHEGWLPAYMARP